MEFASDFSDEGAVFVALGANLPSDGISPEIMVRRAAEALIASHGGGRLSPLFRTTPVDCPPGSPDFVNAVVALPARPGSSPEALHRELLALETAAGRPTVDARAKNAPRPLDLDLLAYGTERRTDAALTIPHPRCHERRFVLEPWAALAPEFEIPGRGKVSELLQALPRG
jgi:2-amino-4-hydroxy-6-hydroxymethyldihydropteridine diphosphokinase